MRTMRAFWNFIIIIPPPPKAPPHPAQEFFRSLKMFYWFQNVFLPAKIKRMFH